VAVTAAVGIVVITVVAILSVTNRVVERQVERQLEAAVEDLSPGAALAFGQVQVQAARSRLIIQDVVFSPSEGALALEAESLLLSVPLDEVFATARDADPDSAITNADVVARGLEFQSVTDGWRLSASSARIEADGQLKPSLLESSPAVLLDALTRADLVAEDVIIEVSSAAADALRSEVDIAELLPLEEPLSVDSVKAVLTRANGRLDLVPMTVDSGLATGSGQLQVELGESGHVSSAAGSFTVTDARPDLQALTHQRYSIPEGATFTVQVMMNDGTLSTIDVVPGQ
jgi:hypothetical protein